MKLKRVNAEDRSDQLEFSAEAEYADGTGFSLVFQVSPAVSGLATGRADAFLLPCALLAMARGEDLEVAAPVSAKLLHNARFAVIPIFRRILSLPREIAIRAPEAVSERYDGERGVVTGFSAGIDSFALLQDYFFQAPPPGYKVTHLLFNNIGSHFPTAEREPQEIYRWRLERIEAFARDIGLPLFRVQSNVQDLLPFEFWQTHSAINASAAFLFQPICAKFLYASGYSYRDIGVRAARDPGIADPILVPSYATESLEGVSVGSHLTRMDKTRIVADMPWARTALDVCFFPSGDTINCGKCDKCVRTLLTLEVLGRLEDFAGLFDMANYRRERGSYVANLASGKDYPFNVEIVELAKSRGYKLLGPGDRVRQRLSGLGFKSAVPRHLKRPLKRLLGY